MSHCAQYCNSFSVFPKIRFALNKSFFTKTVLVFWQNTTDRRRMPHAFNALHLLARRASSRLSPAYNSTRCVSISAALSGGKRTRVDDPRFDELTTFDYQVRTPPRRVYVWGNSQTGALGVTEFVRPQRGNTFVKLKKTIPWRLHLPEQKRLRIRQVSCGYGFTLFVNEPNVRGDRTELLLGCGCNHDSQIGFHQTRDDSDSLHVIIQPVEIALPLRHAKSRVRQVSAGRAHSLILTDEGVFSLGNNAYGQCGRRVIDDEKYANSTIIHRIRDLPDDIEQVIAGLDHSFFLTERGELYSCGWSADGQTGRSSYSSNGVPELVRGDVFGEAIRHVSSGSDCVLALNERGDLFGWGNSEYGQLGPTVESESTARPTRLPFDFGQASGKIVSVASGGSHCAAVTDSGAVFTWGFGLLGRGCDATSSSIPVQISPRLFGETDIGEASGKPRRVEANLLSTAVILDDGLAYAWGRNAFGELGVGHHEVQYYPQQVNVPVPIKQLSLGVDHSACVAQGLV